jgi:succinate dehydrogenase / fumarate reductase cytochrome b subunit
MSSIASRFLIVDRIWKSTIGRKYLVAVTGLFLTLFLAGHLSGNLLVYAGPKAFNDYAYFLHHMLHGAGIWAFRILMIAAIVVHIAATISLSRQNRAARQQYEAQSTIQAKKSSLIMVWSGTTILAFVIYHILHFTVRWANEYDSADRYQEVVMKDGQEITRHNAWQMVIDGFSWWPAALFYLIAMTLLCSHLSHGVQSMFQTLGLRSKKTAGLLDTVSYGYAIAIWLGFVSIPASIYLFNFGS